MMNVLELWIVGEKWIQTDEIGRIFEIEVEKA